MGHQDMGIPRDFPTPPGPSVPTLPTSSPVHALLLGSAQTLGTEPPSKRFPRPGFRCSNGSSAFQPTRAAWLLPIRAQVRSPDAQRGFLFRSPLRAPPGGCPPSARSPFLRTSERSADRAAPGLRREGGPRLPEPAAPAEQPLSPPTGPSDAAPGTSTSHHHPPGLCLPHRTERQPSPILGAREPAPETGASSFGPSLTLRALRWKCILSPRRPR